MSDKLMHRCAIILVIFLILYAGIIFLYKNKQKSEKNIENIQFYTKNVSKYYKELYKNAKIMLKTDNDYDLFVQVYEQNLDIKKEELDKYIYFIDVKDCSSINIIREIVGYSLENRKVTMTIHEKTLNEGIDNIKTNFLIIKIPKVRLIDFDLSDWTQITMLKES